MAGKARRVASRQAQLSRKRKRQLERQPEAAAADPNVAQAPVSVPTEVEAQDNETEPTAADPLETVAKPPSVPAPTRRSNRPITQPHAAASTASPIGATGGGRRERPATFNYMGPELRRITAMASVVLGIIIALGFVL